MPTSFDTGDPLRERLDELKLRVRDELLNALGDCLVVQRVVDAVRGRCIADIGRHVQIDHDGLADLALPVPDPDDGVDLQVVKKNDVHGYSVKAMDD